MECRFCFQDDNTVSLGCRCDQYAHIDCAYTWFKNKTFGRSQGLAIDRQWNVSWLTICEVCKCPLHDYLTETFVAKIQPSMLNKDIAKSS